MRWPFSLVTGCGIITAEEAARDFLPTFCERVQECAPAAFTLAYPGGVDECVEDGVDSIPEENRGRRSACSESQIEQCRSDVQSAACTDIAQQKLPSSCDGC